MNIVKEQEGAQRVSSSIETRDVLNFYRLSIRHFEWCTNFTGDYLSDRELDFLICCIVCMHKGIKDLYSDSAVDVFSTIGKFTSKQEVRIYAQKDRIKRWMIKEGSMFKLPPFLKNLITSKQTKIELRVNFLPDEQTKRDKQEAPES